MKLQTIYGYAISDDVKVIRLGTKKDFKMEPGEEGIIKAALTYLQPPLFGSG